MIQDDGEIKNYWLDGGLKGKFNMANIQPGMLVEIEFLKKEFVESIGHEVNQYEIYELEED